MLIYQVAGSILVIEDEAGIREAVAFHLREQGFQVRECGTLHSALQELQQCRFDLVILDRMLPDGNGTDLCRQLRQQGVRRILVLSALGDLQDRVTGLQSGADDYLVKPFKYEEMTARVRALLRCWTGGEGILTQGSLSLDRSRHRVSRFGNPIALSTLEYRLLETLLGEPGRVFSRQDLLRQVWDIDMPLESNVLEVTISSLRAKLQDRSRRLIRTYRGKGYGLSCDKEGFSK